jgi:predicted anti-sigma-YlaC factor YlaD
MNCQWVKSNLSAYIDKELHRDQESLIDNHLTECHECKVAYDRLVSAWKALDLWEEIEPPVNSKDKILENVKRQRTYHWLRVALPAAAVLLVAISVVILRLDINSNVEVLVKNRESQTRNVAEIADINEEEIITNLHLLREKEFYNVLDTLEKIDYLPLVEEVVEGNEPQERSSLQCRPA